MSPHTVHWPDLYKVAFCAGKQLSVRQTLLRTHLQKKQKERWIMSSDLERQDSLRTVLRKQKRRLSATERKQSSPDLAGGSPDRKSPFSLRNTPVRSTRGTPTRSNRETPTR